MTNTTDLKILIVAPNASSKFGGEAFLPLQHFRILRQRGYPVRLIAHSRNRADIEATLASHLDAIHFIEDSVVHRAIWRTGNIFPGLIRDAIFGTALSLVNETFQARVIRALVQKRVVDIIHQPIPVSPKAPSSLYGFGVPVVIGPMNGGMAYPEGYEDHESRSARRFVGVARVIATLLNRIIPGKRKASALLVANERTRAALPVRNHPRVITLVENGVDLSVWRPDPARHDTARTGTLKLVFMGRLVALKAVDITLDAIRIARESGIEVTLDILGDGAERGALEVAARNLGLGDAVRFLGFRGQDECADILKRADALILNSLRECGGAVVLEAMSLGLPVIASDWGGPADYIDPSCGILVSPTPRANFAVRLAAAITRLAADPMLRR
ncbi:MAG: glycosyltransferase family 4 protein, partial [Thermohalobaculum sp.]|nr:glycosyltransferase family 4 protein [Thermohalobaculum sp.]